MRLLHLAWPHLLVHLACSRDPGLPVDAPIVVGGRPWDDAVVLDASRAARALGVRLGISLGHAARLVPEARFVPPRPAEDAAAVGAALDALAAFSPSVAGTTGPAGPAFGVLEAEVDGLEPLWGPEPVLAARVVAALAPLLPGPPRAAIAGTRFAAALAARAGGGHPGTDEGCAVAPRGGPVIVPPGADAVFLAPFPAWALTRDPDVRGRLARLGLARIGQVAAIPRSALVARFGSEGERLHARANGVEDDPFQPRRPPERVTLALPVEPPVEDLEALRFILRRLGRALAGQLDARGEAAGRARLVLGLDRTFMPGADATGPGDGIDRDGAADHPGDPARGAPVVTVVLEQRFPEPTADAEAIERLLLERLARQPVPAPVERIELELAEVRPDAGQQLTLFVPQANRSARLGWQLAWLAVHYGPDRVGRVALDDPDALLPEGRWSWQPIEVRAP
jgi:protein ImuB